MGSLQLSNARESKSIVHSNNFELSKYSLEFNNIAYADTLGWAMSETVGTMILKVSQHFGKPAPHYNFRHQP